MPRVTFENDEAWQEHFFGLLSEGLKEIHAKAAGFLRKLASWLQKHITDAFEVTYHGKIADLLKGADSYE